ncbi:hypothetical protein NI17_006620 [Thermobifida halotolerans]|uniref:Uncharacterized protein n=1 Tax=Thermobifida halotolerans TaxID=483545 RepID=A0A399G401_9ACTN|nr:hypothetical protein [Thermobifida halotolerans]UOE20850.1 hypothetical protein NI17_006620 [Thermobifida halotolerans]
MVAHPERITVDEAGARVSEQCAGATREIRKVAESGRRLCDSRSVSTRKAMGSLAFDVLVLGLVALLVLF